MYKQWTFPSGLLNIVWKSPLNDPPAPPRGRVFDFHTPPLLKMWWPSCMKMEAAADVWRHRVQLCVRILRTGGRLKVTFTSPDVDYCDRKEEKYGGFPSFCMCIRLALPFPPIYTVQYMWTLLLRFFPPTCVEERGGRCQDMAPPSRL
ncbi:hypothetical protein GDO81_028499 [Engystomops pustulosus]|uniref:Uncharacterized protein n=1 Tax=Engystomops pustulosus TaxID=76066 RepID=A0AAV6YIK8_ENGPU|nr:hypothetical protein GDO81_028499 [Engystomops pustulosus]